MFELFDLVKKLSSRRWIVFVRPKHERKSRARSRDETSTAKSSHKLEKYFQTLIDRLKSSREILIDIVVIESTLVDRSPFVHQVQQHTCPMLDTGLQSVHVTFEIELLVVEQDYDQIHVLGVRRMAKWLTRSGVDAIPCVFACLPLLLNVVVDYELMLRDACEANHLLAVGTNHCNRETGSDELEHSIAYRAPDGVHIERT